MIGEQPPLDFSSSCDGARLRDAGAAAVIEHNPGTMSRLLERLRQVARAKSLLTSDDVRAAAEAAGDPAPSHPNCWAALFRMAQAAHVVTPTGSFPKSSRPEAHARRVQLWRSEIYRGAPA